MSRDDVAPRANTPRGALPFDLPVLVEVISNGADGHSVIHDPDYYAASGELVEMTLQEALEADADFCCDCFTLAWLSTDPDAEPSV